MGESWKEREGGLIGLPYSQVKGRVGDFCKVSNSKLALKTKYHPPCVIALQSHTSKTHKHTPTDQRTMTRWEMALVED